MSASVPPDLESATATATSQFAQLIYTSYDDGSPDGGWRVKAETGELTPNERQVLTSRIVTRFDVGAPLQAYPKPEDIAGRPARLAYAPLSAEAAGYWHTVDAGKDGTGRPGNVMAHVVLDRTVNAPSALRPIQLWGSPKWLRSYAPAEVNAATLTPADLPEPSTETTVASVVQFLTGTTIDRQGVFRVLLDAVYATLTGGPGVMLVTHDLDSGPRWIAAISYFMSPCTARHFSWCSHDDPTLAVSDLRRGTNLVVVGVEAARKASGEQWAVIDEAEEPSIGEVGSVHRTTKGDVAVTGWSVLAEGVLESEETAIRLLASQDAVAAELGDHDLSPGWPLAVAVRRDPALREYHADADLIIADEQPDHVDAVAWVAEIVAEAVAGTTPDNAQESLDRLVRAHRRCVGVTVAARRLLQTALVDPQWIASGPLADVPNANVVELEPLRPLVDDAIDSLRTAGPEASEGLRIALRLTQLLQRLGLSGPALDHALDPVRAMIGQGAASLVDVTASSALCADPAICTATREDALRPAVARLAAPLLYRIDVGVWAWLFGDATADPVIPANPQLDDSVLMAHYIRAALEGADEGDRTTKLAGHAAFLALDAQQLGDDECRALIDAISQVSRLDASDLVCMFAQWPQRISPRVASVPVYYERVPVDLLNTLAARAEGPADTEDDRVATTAARLRVLRHAPRPWTDDQVARAVTDAGAVIQQHLPSDHLSMVDPDLIDVLGAAFIIGQIRGAPWADARSLKGRALGRRLAGRTAGLADVLAELVRAGVLGVEWFVGHALLVRIGGVLDGPVLVTDTDVSRPGLSDAVLAEMFKLNAYAGPTDATGLRDSAWGHVRTLSADQAERFFDGYQRAARDWLQDNRIGRESGQRMFRPNF